MYMNCSHCYKKLSITIYEHDKSYLQKEKIKRRLYSGYHTKNLYIIKRMGHVRSETNKHNGKKQLNGKWTHFRPFIDYQKYL